MREDTLVCCSTELASWRTVDAFLDGSVFVLIQHMSSHRLKPHFFRQCLPASRPSALPHLQRQNLSFSIADAAQHTSRHLQWCTDAVFILQGAESAASKIACFQKGHPLLPSPCKGTHRESQANTRLHFCPQGIFLPEQALHMAKQSNAVAGLAQTRGKQRMVGL